MSDWRMRPEVCRVVEVIKVNQETEDVFTLYFRDGLCSGASPGQYVMVWAPGIDEVPMSLSTIDEGSVSSITVRSVGDATRALCRIRVGDRVGLRGPFGNGFSIVGFSPLLVGGGTGIVTMAPLAVKMLRMGLKPTFVMGARSADQLLFRDYLEGLLEDCALATDDGSAGFKGFASECAHKLLKERHFDSVYTCGPEPMMVSVFNEADKTGIPVQASLERYIKCAVGLCGSCGIGPYRVCKDGPVFDSDRLRAVMSEFGLKRMAPSGRLVDLE